MHLIMGLGSAIGRAVITVTDLIIITGVVIAGEEEATTGAVIMAVGVVAEATGVGAAVGITGKCKYPNRAFQAT